MFKLNKKTSSKKKAPIVSSVSIAAFHIVNIPDYKIDEKHPFCVTTLDKLTACTITGFDKKPIRTLTAIGIVAKESALYPITGEHVIVLDKKLVNMAKHKLTRKEVLAAIELQCAALQTPDYDNRLCNDTNEVGNGVFLDGQRCEINAHLLTAERYGFTKMKKAVHRHNHVIFKSEAAVLRKLHRAYTKDCKVKAKESEVILNNPTNSVVDGFGTSVEEMIQKTVETVDRCFHNATIPTDIDIAPSEA